MVPRLRTCRSAASTVMLPALRDARPLLESLEMPVPAQLLPRINNRSARTLTDPTGPAAAVPTTLLRMPAPSINSRFLATTVTGPEPAVEARYALLDISVGGFPREESPPAFMFRLSART